jgi:hypothetical protein
MLNDLILEECGQKTTFNDDANNDKMNVLILTIDSLARNQLERQMPLTFKYLTSQLKDNVFFEQLNTIGVNTHPNMLPFFTGILLYPPEQLNLTNEQLFYHNIDLFYDIYPFIWREYEKAGYLTSYQEEMVNIGTFNYLKKGFRYKPTAFYGHPLWMK